MNTKLNKHGVDVSQIKAGDLVAVRVNMVDPSDDVMTVHVMEGNDERWIENYSIIRHIPANEPPPAPAKSIADKPASEMTIRQKIALDVLAGFACDPLTAGTPVADLAEAATKWADALLAAIEGSAGK